METTGALLRQVARRWQVAMSAALEPHGLTAVQYDLLVTLIRLEAQPKVKVLDRVNQRRLADDTGTDPMVTSQVLRALEARGLLERRPDEWDRRAKTLHATDAGRTLARAGATDVEACDRAFFAPLEDAPAFAGALETLRAG